MPRPLAPPLLLVLVLLLAGCGISDPYTHPQPSATQATTQTSRPLASAPERDGPPPSPASTLSPSDYATTPNGALTRYASLYLNWNWQTIRRVERQLVSISQDQARAQALSGALQPPGQLAQYQVRNAGQVTAIAQGEGPERGKWAVVADERTIGSGAYQGLPAVSEVIWATLTHTSRGWVVTGWYPAGATP